MHTDFSTFSNFPVNTNDNVSLKIKSNDLAFLVDSLTMSNQAVLTAFWKHFEENYDS